MLIQQKQRGVSLIELMIAITIVSLLMVAGAPSFGLWIQSAQTRTAAESILNGLQLARTEAVRRNANVRFTLTNGTGAVAWTVGCVNVTANCPADIQSRDTKEGGKNPRAGASIAVGTLGTPLAAGAGLPGGITFDGIGRVPTANIGTDISRIDVTNAANANARRMVILVSTGGQTRMCDPAIARSTNPQGCS